MRNWLQDVREKHLSLLSGLGEAAQMDRLCELNVVEQVSNVGRTTLVKVPVCVVWRGVMHAGRVEPRTAAHPARVCVVTSVLVLTARRWVYRLDNGLIHDLGMSCSSADELASQYHRATTPTAPAPSPATLPRV